tara:strand:+ start:6499 stop:6849 length:351 start_codon:yes stop_codon:yes gene_type:complete
MRKLERTPIRIKEKSEGVDWTTSWNAILAPKIVIENSKTYFDTKLVPGRCHRNLGKKFLKQIPVNKAIINGSRRVMLKKSVTRTIMKDINANRPTPGNIFSELPRVFFIRYSSHYI